MTEPQHGYELQRQVQDDYTGHVNDRGSSAREDLSLLTPALTSDYNLFLGMVGEAGYSSNPNITTWIYNQTKVTPPRGNLPTVPILAPPIGYRVRWACDVARDCHMGIFSFDAPLEYVGLGVVATSNYNQVPTQVPGLMCVHQSYCHQITLLTGDRIWTDAGSGANLDASIWRLPTAGIAVIRSFDLPNRNQYPDSVTVWDLNPAKFS